MKFKVESENFSKAFNTISKVVTKNEVRPILMNVLVKSNDDGNLSIQATDLDIAIRNKFPGEVIESGEVLLPAKTISKILSIYKDDEITIESNENGIVISGSRFNYKLPARESESFPEFNIVDFNDDFNSVSPELFIPLIDRTVFAIDDNNQKYSLSGVLLDFDEDEIFAVSTDGRRCCVQQVNSGHIGNTKSSHIIPTKTLAIIKSAVQSEGQTVYVKVYGSENLSPKLYVKCGNIEITSTLIDGRFPKWRNIIPQEGKREQIDVLVETFLNSVRAASIVTTQLHPGIELVFSNAGNTGTLEITASADTIGESKIHFPISYSGEKMTVKFDPVYLADCLSRLPKDEVISLHVKENESMLISTNDGYRYIIMPLK